MKLYDITTDVTLTSGLIAIWMTDGNCPAGYTEIDVSGGNFYIGVSNTYSTGSGEAHTHAAQWHTHDFSSCNTDVGGSHVGGRFVIGPYAKYVSHTHVAYGCSPNTMTASNTSSTASPGLNHVDVVLCKKD